MNNKKVNPYIEVREVLKLIGEEEKDKIPQNILISINEKCNGNDEYKIEYDDEGRIVLSQDAESILLYLYKKYILIDNEQLQMAIDKKTKSNQNIKNIIKNISNQKIVLNDLFVKSTKKVNNEFENKEIIPKKNQRENFIKRIIKKIKDLVWHRHI